MKKGKLDLRVEVENVLENKPMSEIDFCIKMQKLTLFLYRESVIFFAFLPIFMGSFFYSLVKYGPTKITMLTGLVECIMYLAFYLLLIKKIKPFSNRAEEYKEIKDKLDVLIEYKNFRLAQ